MFKIQVAVLHIRNAQIGNLQRSCIFATVYCATRLHDCHIPQTHDVPAGGDGSEASDLLPLCVATGEASGEEVVEQGVAQTLGGGDDLLGALNRLVNGVKHCRDRALLVSRRDQQRKGVELFASDGVERTSLCQPLKSVLSAVHSVPAECRIYPAKANGSKTAANR